MEDQFDSKLLEFTNSLTNNFNNKAVKEVQPLERQKIYQIALDYEKSNFLRRLEVIVCNKYSNYLIETPLETYLELLSKMNKSILSDSPITTIDPQYEFYALEAKLQVLDTDFENNPEKMANASAIAFCIVKALDTIVDKFDWLLLRKNLQHHSNDDLDIYHMDASFMPSLLEHENHSFSPQYWVWWLKYAIPQASENC